MRKRLLISALIAAALAVQSAAAYQLFMPQDPEVRELVSLYTRAGLIFPDASYPLGKADLDEYAARLLDTPLRGAGLAPVLQAAVRSYRQALDFQTERASVGVDYGFQAAGTVHGDAWPEDSDAETASETAGVNDFTRYPNDFHTRFVEFPDMAFLSMYAGEEGVSGMHISAGIKREFHPDEVPSFNLPRASQDDPFRVENYFIRSGYLAWRSDRFEARFGRTPVHYGDARFSTFLPADNLPWLDAFTYRYRLGPLTMTSYFGTLENRVSDDEAVLFGIGDDTLNNGYRFAGVDSMYVGFNEDGVLVTGDSPGFDEANPAEAESQQMAFAETTIVSAMHRFIFNWERFRLGLTAHSLIARERNALLIGDIFPVFSWHNALVGHHNMHLVFEGSYALQPGLVLYGQAAWDDINASDLLGIPDSEQPTIGAYLLGVAWLPNTDLSFKAELGSTHYMWGTYYSYHPDKGGYFERAIYRYKAQKGVYWMPLTSPYGPGVVWVDGEFSVQLPRHVKLSFGGKYLSINSAADLLALSHVGLEGVGDAPRIDSYSVWGKAVWSLTPGSDSLQFSVKPVLYSYDGHMWPEVELAVSYKGSKTGDL